MTGMLGAIWGITGILLLLGSASYRLSVLGIKGLSYDFAWYHWAVLVMVVIFMAYAEGFKGFQRGFSPRAAARAKYLRDKPDLLRTVLAPFFCMGYFHATHKRKIVSISLTAGIILLVLHVHYVPQPWRGIIDVGVVIGLGWGMISLVVFSVKAFTSESFAYSAEVPEQDRHKDEGSGSGMRAVVLGSGTCVPSLRRNAPGYYIRAGGLEVLVDCGSGTLLQLERAGSSYSNIDIVFITHTHADHIADLLPLLHARSAAPSKQDKKDIMVIGPKGISEYYENCILSIMSRPDSFNVIFREAEEKMQEGDLKVRSANTVHSRESIAYRFEYRGKVIVITGDGDYDEALADLARDADILIADCSFPDEEKLPGHMTPKECGLLASRAGIGTLVLSHIYPASSPDKLRISEARNTFEGEIVLAEDLMEFAL